jgi:endonuclease I
MLKPHLILSTCRSNAHNQSNMIATYLPSFAKAFLICLVGLILGNSNSLADTVAYWNFNSLSIATASAPGAGGVPTTITASQGSGTVDLTGWTGLVDDFGGNATNALSSDPAEEALCFVSNTGNGSYMEIQLNLAEFADPIVTFVTRGTSSGYSSGAWSYSVGGGNFTTLAGVNTATVSATFALATVDFTAINAVDGQSNVRLRYTLNGASSTSGNNRMDNLQVNATRTSDNSAPVASALAPLDNATNIPVTATPTITFSESMKKGVGSILIKRSSDNSTFESIDVTSAQVTVSGAAVTITPGSNFANSTGYYIQIPAGALEDIAGNDFAGISGATAWNFTTIAPSVLPSATETFTSGWAVKPTGPSATADYYAEGSGQGIHVRYDLGVFNFTKLDFGLSGASQITGINSAEFTLRQNKREFSTGTQFEFFLTTDAPTGKTFNSVYANGIDAAQFTNAPISLGQFTYTPTNIDPTFNTFTLNLTESAKATLAARINTGEDFSIIIAAVNAPDAITFSGKGNTFDPGDPALKLTVNETTGVDTTAPSIGFLTPSDGSGGLPIASNLRVNFNELIQKGTGNIIIRRADDTIFETIDVTSAAVTVNLGTVTIDPTNSFETAGSYSVQITPGAIKDIAGNNFAGISDSTTWNFGTAQPPITATGPFNISENAAAGTVVGSLNPLVQGKEGIKYTILGGSGGSTLMKATPGAGYFVSPVFTIGDTVEGATGALNSTSAGNFSPPGTPDGLGAYSLNATTVRVFMNHEIALPTSGSAAYPYTLANGVVITKGGARITYFDIDKSSRRVKDAGLAIRNIYDRSGNLVTNSSQLDLGGLDRLCSASLHEPQAFGTNRGLVDRIYLTGEESSTPFGHPHGGTFWALDTATGNLWALPDFGRGSWENAAPVDTGNTTHVAFLLGDDAPARPMYLYVGVKDTSQSANFIQRNGLSGGQLYVWKASNDNTTPEQFNGSGSFRSGTWVAINAKNAGAAGTTGHDAAGYKNDTTLKTEADAKKAFSFSRPEDLATNPADGTMVVFTSTGRGSIYPSDNWGDTYVIDIDFNSFAVPESGFLRIIYSGDDSGKGQFAEPESGLRCPDNLDWADDGSIYVQEDQSNQVGEFGKTGFETSIWRLDVTGDLRSTNPVEIVAQATRVAETDRSTVLPLGSTDGNTTDVGNWESSGIIDVSTLFNEAAGTLFLFDIQAHSITNGQIAAKNLFEGGQLCFLEKGSEYGAFSLNTNTGVITLTRSGAIDLDTFPIHGLRLQAFDGTNSTFKQITINVTNTAATKTNNIKVATYNTSLYRDTAGTLINDLAGVTNTQAQHIARVIQRNNPDVILLNEFDYDTKGTSIKRFKENYLEVAQSGEAPVYYPYVFVAPSNTGIHSGFDLDNNGSVVSTPGAAGYGEDAFGFGTHSGQYSFVVLSKYPIDTANIRTFQKFLWKDMPGALLPDHPDLSGTGDWYSTAELNAYRLSSKNHADVPILVNGTPIHILASHPTPPVFDSPGAGLPWKTGVDHNGRRNSDEIRFWSDYVNPANSTYIYDDTETAATASGGLPPDSRFVICGDLNADNNEGDSTDPAIKQIIGGNATSGGAAIPANPLVNSTFLPAGGAGPQADDTAAFSGGVRVDYALPSNFGLTVNSGGVFWPASNDSMSTSTSATDHYMVLLNMTISGVSLPPNTEISNYYALATGLTGMALQSALHEIVDNHTVIDYNTVDEVMQVIDAVDSTNIRLIYSNANLPKTSFVGSVPDAVAWNREHVWPRNDGVGQDGPDFSDLHHLFPCQVNVNSLRSALYFDESTNQESDPFAPESFKDTNSWEPLDRDKGVVARAALYMMTRYDGNDALTEDLVLNNSPIFAGNDMGKLDTLLAWHKAFPPSEFEKSRNNAIYSGVTVGSMSYAQGNRNPFIDYPQFADAMLLTAGTTTFEKWQVSRFTLSQLSNSTISDRTADYDGDGRTNYAEFLLNTNPLSAAETPLTLTSNGNQITLTFFRPRGTITEQVEIQTTTTLQSADWVAVPNWEASSITTTIGDYERIDFTTTVSQPSTETRRFWRVVYK